MSASVVHRHAYIMVNAPSQGQKQPANVLSQHEVRPGNTSLGIEQECDTVGATAGETAPHSPAPSQGELA